MNANLEMIDELRKRANVSYEEAREALEQCSGDMVEALIYLERNNRVRNNGYYGNKESSFVNTVKGLIKKGQVTKFVMTKQERVIINVPVNAVVLTTIIAPPVTIVGALVGLFTNHRFKFVKPNGGDMEINRVFDKMSSAVATVTTSNDIAKQ